MYAYQAQQIEEQVCVFAYQVVGLTAEVYKVMEAAGWLVSSIDHVRHVRGEHKRSPVPANHSTPHRHTNQNTGPNFLELATSEIIILNAV